MKKRIVGILFAILIISSMGGLIPTASAIDVSNYTMLNIPWEYIQECGSQSVSNQTTACQAYAWAYCRIILDNRLHTWSNYWDFSVGQATNPIVAGYNSVINDPNEQAILKGIYDNINIGRPVVLRARGSNGYNYHYVVAVGYKIDCDPQKLLQSDILILDPWDGTTKSLTTIPLKANQDSNYGYWTAQSGGVSIATTGAFSNLPYFTCNVRITCINGQTVNLYNNPGDASRVTYFSLGQIVNSACGMVRSDGSTWYQITANHNGTPKTFWLKYESGKMTVTNLMSKGPYTLTPKCAPSTRLDVKGGSAEDEANVQIYTSNGTAAQQWELTYLGNGYYTIISKASGKALDVAGASTESGTNVQQYTPNGTNAQQWMLKDAGEGYYYIVPRVNTGLCLDVTGAGTADKTNVEIYTANGTDAQKWKLTAPEISYTVTFNPNGGSISQSSKTVTTGQKYGDLPMPSRSGYIFDGWYTSANGGTQVTAATTVNLTGNQTLYAQWKINCFNHTYDADTCTNCGARLPYDNGFDASAAGTYRVSENTAYIRTGPYQVKDLVGTMNRGETLRVVGSVINSYNNIWMKTADGYYVHADKLTLYSETQSQSYYVFLDDGPVCSRITVTNGETYGNFPTPAKEGYSFDGWYTSASGGVRVTSTTTVNLTGNQTLYAHWTKEEPTICSHVKGQLQYSDTLHPHYNHYTCSKCGESFTDYSVTPDRSCNSCWGPWSSWSVTPVSASSTREVETRQATVSDSCTEYRYGRYVDGTGRNAGWCTTYLTKLGFSGMTVQYSDWTTFRYPTKEKDWTCGVCGGPHTGVHHYSTDGRAWWKEYVSPQSGNFFWEESRQTDAVYETQYRYRDLITP